MDHTTRHSTQALLGSTLIVLGAVCFSAKSIFVKLAYARGAQVDAITLMTLRMLIALPFFLGVALWHHGDGTGNHSRRDWLALAGLGVMGYYLASLLDFMGLAYISAGLERLILFLYPTFVVLLTALIHRRPIEGMQGLSLAVSYAGIALVYGAQATAASSDLTLGALLVLGSALAFAVYMTLSGHYIPRFGSRRFTAWSMSVACGVTIGHFLASRPLAILAVPEDVLALAAVLALISTVLPAFLVNAGIRRIGADRAAIIGTVGPVSTLALAALVLDETLTGLQIMGAALVIGGVALASMRKTNDNRRDSACLPGHVTNGKERL